MILALIGMSNSGKTYWSKKLEKIGFKRFGCDDIIEKKLEKELINLGYSGINDVAKWMGQPYDKQYPQTSTKYLDFEKESLNEILKIFNHKSISGNIVIDTTGSVIYTGNKILAKLRMLTKVIYLDTPKYVQDEMYQSYLKNLKPVIWGDAFCRQNGESDIETLKRCYPYFLEYRTRKYQEIAHYKFDYVQIRDSIFTTYHFLKHIKNDSLQKYQR